ncbi:MAG: sigma-70 family RNA polymerase sigma factor [Planctomycetaceae bacterium]|nr:sigma-70 family RNA polymerase sigma factor [Planctomycetaceae bacterium]
MARKTTQARDEMEANVNYDDEDLYSRVKALLGNWPLKLVLNMRLTPETDAEDLLHGFWVKARKHLRKCETEKDLRGKAFEWLKQFAIGLWRTKYRAYGGARNARGFGDDPDSGPDARIAQGPDPADLAGRGADKAFYQAKFFMALVEGMDKAGTKKDQELLRLIFDGKKTQEEVAKEMNIRRETVNRRRRRAIEVLYDHILKAYPDLSGRAPGLNTVATLQKWMRTYLGSGEL